MLQNPTVPSRLAFVYTQAGAAALRYTGRPRAVLRTHHFDEDSDGTGRLALLTRRAVGLYEPDACGPCHLPDLLARAFKSEAPSAPFFVLSAYVGSWFITRLLMAAGVHEWYSECAWRGRSKHRA